MGRRSKKVQGKDYGFGICWGDHDPAVYAVAKLNDTPLCLDHFNLGVSDLLAAINIGGMSR